MATRCSEMRTRQPSPMSWGPATKNGSTMRSRASDQIFEGAGSVAPGFMHRTCHTASMSASMTSGGMVRVATVASAGRILVFTKLGFGVDNRSTVAVAGETATDGSVLTRGMVIQRSPSPREASGSRRAAARARSHLDALDRQALEVGARVLGVEDLAVEEGLLAARRRFRDVGCRQRHRLGGGAPEILAVHFVYKCLGIHARLELAPADVFGDEPEIVTLERIGRVLAPEFHVLLGALLHSAVAVVHVTLQPADDVGNRHVEPLALADDLGELLLVLHLLAPLLRLHHGHQQRLDGVGMLVGPFGAQTERLLRMLGPDLAGGAGRKADALVDELLVPRLADTEGVHV